MAAELAIVEGARGISRAELVALVAARRDELWARGIGPGARVALRCRADAGTLIAQLALLETGATTIPVGEVTGDERARLIERCGISWVLEGQELARVGDASGRREAALGLLSSGSTGAPKLVLISRAQLGASLEIYRHGMELSGGDRVLSLVPLEHGFGLRLAHATLGAGGCVLVPDGAQPRVVLAQARAQGATVLAGGPRFLELLARAAMEPLPELRVVLVAGGTTTRAYAALRERLGAPVWQSYGASEAGSICLNRDGHAAGELLSLGVPSPGVTVSVVGGEIVVRSPAVGLAHEGDGGDSAIVSGELHTGDLGRWQDGRLVFEGRRKLLIATGADKVDPAEVEEVLRRHPMIVDAAVVGEGPPEAQVVKAILVTSSPLGLGLLEVTEHCARWLSAHKIPRVVECRDGLPRDALGKLRRDAL